MIEFLELTCIQPSFFTTVIRSFCCAWDSGNWYTLISERKFVPGLREHQTSEQQHGPHCDLDIKSLIQAPSQIQRGTWSTVLYLCFEWYLPSTKYAASNSDITSCAHGNSFETVYKAWWDWRIQSTKSESSPQ